MRLMVICSWCGKFIRFKSLQRDIPPKNCITHGICDDCRQQVKTEINKMKGGYHYERQCESSVG